MDLRFMPGDDMVTTTAGAARDPGVGEGIGDRAGERVGDLCGTVIWHPLSHPVTNECKDVSSSITYHCLTRHRERRS